MPSKQKTKQPKTQKSHSTFLVVSSSVLFLLIGLIIGFYSGKAYSPSSYELMPGPIVNPEVPVVCTLDVKVCPDGSSVGRVGPNCEFTPCPGEESSAQ